MNQQISYQNGWLTSGEAEFAVVPHHPDRLRRPARREDGRGRSATELALTWNVFRTLELLPPAFWLRRLRARLQDTSLGAPAPTTARVSLWRPLPPAPPQAALEGGSPVLQDVVIETEFTVWTLLTVFGRDLESVDHAAPDPVLQAIDAGSWYAGTREYCFGLIVRDPSEAPIAAARVRRYAQNKLFVINRLPHRVDRLQNVGAIGLARWADLSEILQDCAASDALHVVERGLASRALDWMTDRA